MLPLRKKQEEKYKNQELCHTCKQQFHDINTDEISSRVQNHCHYTGKLRGATSSIYYLKHEIPKVIPVVLHNVSNYYYNLIIKELAEEFKGQFKCSGENTDK